MSAFSPVLVRAGKIIETKVVVGLAGAGASGGVVGPFVVWLLGVVVWHQSGDADHVAQAVAAVPVPVVGMVTAVLAALGSFVGGYVAPHTARPDLEPLPEIQPEPTQSEQLEQSEPSIDVSQVPDAPAPAPTSPGAVTTTTYQAPPTTPDVIAAATASQTAQVAS